MAEFIVCFGSDDEKKENKRKKATHHTYTQFDKRKKNKKTQKETIKNNNNTEDGKQNGNNLLILKETKIYSEDFKQPNISNIENSPTLFEEELDSGNKEYKLKLCGINNQKLEKRITQMKFRLREGNGECHYYIGVEDDGNPLGISENEMKISINTIEKMVSEIENAKITKIVYLKGQKGLISEITIIRINNNLINEKISNINNNQNYEELKIGLIGEENSGKSTLVGCLISDKKDNGNGLTRTNVFKHRHEINCGKTSSFTHQIMGFDKNGMKTNINNFGNLNTWYFIVNNSEKIINFIDMGGSEKSLKNSLKMLSNNYLDYIVLCISVDKGITNNTLIFLEMIFKLNIPVIVVFTKIDLINENDRSNILFIFGKVLKKFKCGKNPLVVKNKDDIVMFSSNMNEGIMPIFLLSNKTGEGLDYLNNFFSILPNKEENKINTNKNNNDINNILNMRFDFLKIHKDEEGKNENKFIVEGIVTQGKILSNELYNLGPFDIKNNNSFIKVKVLSIHCKKMTVQYSVKGQFCSLEISLLKELNLYEKIRSGMVLIGNKVPQISCKKFQIELWSLKSNEKDIVIKKSYQPLIHLEHISQVCKFITEDNEIIIPCDKSIIIDVEFIYYPEYVRKNSYLIILDNNLKLYGTVRDVYT